MVADESSYFACSIEETEFAIELARRRKAANLSQRELAGQVAFAREYLSRAEKPGGLISADAVRIVDAALLAGGALTELHDRATKARKERRRRARRSAARAQAEIPRTQPDGGFDGQGGSERPGSGDDLVPVLLAHVPAQSASLDVDPACYAIELASLQGVDQDKGPECTLPGVLDLLKRIYGDIACSRGFDRQRLLLAASRSAEFAGFLCRDLTFEAKCLYWHDRAMELAQQAGLYSMQAYILLRKAQAAYDRRDASRMLDLTFAAESMDAPFSPGLRAELIQQRARGEAMLGADGNVVRRRLDQAAAVLHSSADYLPNNEPGAGYSERQLGIQSALCLSEAGRPHDAVLRYREMIDSNLSRRDHAYFSILMATSLALSGEPDEATRVACMALPVAAETRSRRSLGEARRLVDILGPWRGRHQVEELQIALLSAERDSSVG